MTNADDTYALFRSQAPVVALPGNMELDPIATTLTFRTDFTFEGTPAATELVLDCAVDDGAVFYINGAEVQRQNMPNGAVDAGTLADAEVVDLIEFYAEVSAEPLVPGLNVLAVEVHQAEPDDLDLFFGCGLTAETVSDRAGPTILLNEVPPAGESPLWVELLNVSGSTHDVGGLVLASSVGEDVLIPDAALEPGEVLALDDLGLTLEAGDLLFLYSAEGDALLDAIRVGDGLRARAEDGGPWRVPVEATP